MATTQPAAVYRPRAVEDIANSALKSLSRQFDALYSPIGGEPVPPGRLLRALLPQAFYSSDSKRQLVERINYDPHQIGWAENRHWQTCRHCRPDLQPR